MKKKTLLSLFVGILAIVGIVIFNFQQEKIDENTKTAPLRTHPKINQDVKAKYNITTTIKESEYNIPSTIPTIQVDLGNPITVNEAQNIAKGLNLTTLPKVAHDIDQGDTFIWSTSAGSLLVYSNSRRVFYSKIQPKRVVNLNLSDNEIINIASDFLKNSLGIANINFDSIVYQKMTSTNLGQEGLIEVEKNKSDFYQVNFSPSNEDLKILTLDPKTTPIYVWVEKDGSVSKAEGVLFGNITKSIEKVRIKNYSQVLESLNDAIFINIENETEGHIYRDDILETSQVNVVISKIEIAYIADSRVEKTFHPVFLLTGKASITGYEGELNTTLYLPADTE